MLKSVFFFLYLKKNKSNSQNKSLHSKSVLMNMFANSIGTLKMGIMLS